MTKNRGFHTVRGYQMLNSEKKLLTPSMEDYLEMIYRVCQYEEYVRVNALAEKLNVRPSSTTNMLKRLKELDLVDYEKYGVVQLTQEGRKMGKFLLARHEVVERFLRNLGITKTLLRDTEMMEHDVSLATLENMHMMNEFLAENPDTLKQYQDFKKHFDKDTGLPYEP